MTADVSGADPEWCETEGCAYRFGHDGLHWPAVVNAYIDEHIDEHTVTDWKRVEAEVRSTIAETCATLSFMEPWHHRDWRLLVAITQLLARQE